MVGFGRVPHGRLAHAREMGMTPRPQMIEVMPVRLHASEHMTDIQEGTPTHLWPVTSFSS